MIKRGNYDLAAEFLHSVKPLKSPFSSYKNAYYCDDKSNVQNKSRNVFPYLKSEQLTMVIFSYLDVHHRALDLLKRLNSKGYDIYKK